MSFEADLASKGPGTLNTRVVGEGTQECVVGGGEVLEDGETGADWVRAEVRERGEGILLVLEDKAANELGIEFDYHWRGGRWFLGGYGKGTGEGEVEGGGVLGGEVTFEFGGLEDGCQDLLVDYVGDLGGGGVAGDGEAMDAEGVGPGGLVQSVDFLVEFIDDLVLVSDFLAQGGVLDDQGVHGLLDDVDLGKLGADGVKLGMELG